MQTSACHLCGAESDALCERCGRPMCSRHTESWLAPVGGGYQRVSQCSTCAPVTRLEQEQRQRAAQPDLPEEAAAAEAAALPAAERPPAGSAGRSAHRAFRRTWAAWTGLGAALGVALIFTVSSAPAVISDEPLAVVLSVSPALLLVLIGWVLHRQLLLPFFAGEATWLALSYVMVLFAVFLGLSALGVALLLLLLGLRNRLTHVLRWSLACALGAMVVFLAVLVAPQYLPFTVTQFLLLGGAATAMMAGVTGAVLRTML